MEAFMNLIAQMVKEFTWRWFVFVVVVLGLGITGLWVFEAFTGHFRSSRMQSDVEHLKALSDPELKKNVQGDPELEKAHNQLKVDFNRLLEQSQVDVGVPDPLWKAGSAFAIWMVVGFIVYFGSGAGEPATLRAIVVIAVVFGFIGSVIPTFSPRWLNYLAYPVGSVLLVFIVGLLVGRVSRARSAPTVPPQECGPANEGPADGVASPLTGIDDA
jgi:hypothetical protein